MSTISDTVQLLSQGLLIVAGKLKSVQFPHFMVYLSMSPLLSTLKYDKIFDIARPMSVLLVAFF